MSDDSKTVATPEEVTAKVVEEFGFDPDTQGEQIERLTNERIENQKNLSKTIEQKVKYREIGVEKGLLDPNTFEPIDKKPDGEPLNKTNAEQGNLTMDDLLLVQKGLSEEEIKIVKQSAKLLEVKAVDAYDNDIVQAKINSMRNEAKLKSTSIGASGGSHQPSVKKPLATCQR